jgi:hypothetical protein
VAAILVVGLPGDHRRVLAVAARDRLNDPGALGPVTLAGEVVVPA